MKNITLTKYGGILGKGGINVQRFCNELKGPLNYTYFAKKCSLFGIVFVFGVLFEVEKLFHAQFVQFSTLNRQMILYRVISKRLDTGADPDYCYYSWSCSQNFRPSILSSNQGSEKKEIDNSVTWTNMSSSQNFFWIRH